MKTKFQIQCEALSEKTNIDVMFFDDDRKSQPFEDDGNLHIVKRGLRACFDVGRGQSLDGKEQNTRTKEILNELGLSKFINKQTLVEEVDEESDGYCS